MRRPTRTRRIVLDGNDVIVVMLVMNEAKKLAETDPDYRRYKNRIGYLQELFERTTHMEIDVKEEILDQSGLTGL